MATIDTQTPVEEIGTDDGQPEQGVALCLSGGGYRAMLYHTGALIRINELGLLPQLNRISSVSGGSITAAVLALQWKQFVFVDNVASNFKQLVVPPIQHIADQSIDVSAVGWGTFNPTKSIADVIADYYDKYLFHGATLQSLPDSPRFVINASNVKTGSLVRFSKPYIADYRVGVMRNPRLRLATAVAASSAFPPFLSPMELAFSKSEYEADDKTADLTTDEYRERVVLTDGGVYDNLGIETAWKRYTNILVSDGGRRMSLDPYPKNDWAFHSKRLIDLLQHQTCSLRRRQVIDSFKSKVRGGAYWGIQSKLDAFQTDGTVALDASEVELANTDTRLSAISRADQRGIMKLGYALCDAALRSPVRHFIGDIRIREFAPDFKID